ncbi:MAG: hypothetical protein ABID40_01710 [Candidatus Bipolaricaulota bacterium]
MEAFFDLHPHAEYSIPVQGQFCRIVLNMWPPNPDQPVFVYGVPRDGGARECVGTIRFVQGPSFGKPALLFRSQPYSELVLWAEEPAEGRVYFD